MNTTQISSFHIALICLAVLQLADWYTTRTILARGGRELNPIIRKLISFMGIDLALIAKGVLLVWVAGLYCDVNSLMLMVAVYLAVIVNNVRVLLWL